MKQVLRNLLYAGLLTLAMTPAAQAQLSGSPAPSAGQVINLTAQGTADWAHWGLTAGTDFNHKNGANLISDETIIDAGDGPNQFTDSQAHFSWTDGTPTGSATNTPNGIFTNGGFEFTAPADTTARQLKVYVGGYQSTGTFTAHLSDGSAPDYVDAGTVGQNGVGNTDGNHYYAVYTITYKAASAGQTIDIKWEQTAGAGNLTLQAATLGASSVTLPSAPTGLIAVAGDSRVVLSFSAVAGADSYNILRSVTNGSGYTQIANTSATTYQDTGLTNGKTYYYVVQAVNFAGHSANSAQVSATPNTGLDGTGLTGEYHTGDNNGAPPFNPATTIFTEVDPTINYDFINGPFPAGEDMLPGTTGNRNNFSVRWTGLVKAQVTGPYVFSTASDDGSRIWLDGVLVADDYAYQGVTTRSSAPINLVAGSLHTIRVQFFQGGGGAAEFLSWSYPGQSTQIIPAYALYPTYGTNAPPTVSLSGIPGAQSATLFWAQPEDATSYSLKRSATPGGPYTTVATVAPNGTLTTTAPPAAVSNVNGANTDSYTDTGLSNGVTYYYVVVANNASGSSANSNEVAVTPTPPVIGNGTGLAGLFYAPGSNDFSAEANPPIYYEIDPTVNYNHGNTTGYGATEWPAGLIAVNGGSSDQFTAVWTGQFLAPYTGSYQFQTITDDGARFSIDLKDGNGLKAQFDDETGHGPLANTGAPVTLTAGQKYNIKFEMFNGGGGYTAQLLYNPLNTGFVIIPQTQLFPTSSVAPNPITDLAAAAGSASILLTWNTPFYAGSYNVKRSATSGGPYTTIATGVTGNSYLDTTVTVGTTYYYVVDVVNNIGVSADSNQASAKAVAPFASNGDGLYGLYYHGGAVDFSAENNSPFLARIDPTINYNGGGNTTGYNAGPWPAGVPTINFTTVWTGKFLAPYTGSYQLQTITDDGSRLSIDLNDGNGLQPLFDDETGHGPLANTGSAVNLTAGVKYSLKFEYTQGGGGYTAQLLYALNTAPFAIIPQSYLFSNLTTPGAPTGLTASAGNAKVGLSWNFAPMALSFNVLRSTTHNGPYTQIATGITGTLYTDTTVTNGVTYFYVVQAVNGTGTSGNSNEASATPNADTLILHYTFENGPSGTDPDPITDVSLHGNDGRAIGGDTDFTMDAKQGTWAGVTTDATHYIALPNAFDFGPQFTFFAWVKMSNDVSGIQTIVATNGTGGATGGFAFYVNDFNSDSHDLVFETNVVVNGNNVQTKALSPAGIFPIGDGLYHAVACVVDAPGGKVSMYFDGAAVVTNATIDNQWPTQSGGNTLGLFPFTLDELNPGSQFDDVRVYNVMLSAAQIAALSSGGPTVSGRIALEGVNSLTAVSAGAPLGTFHVSFRTPNTTTEVFGADVTLTPVGAGNPYGTFTVTGVPAGTYDVAIKGNKNLRVSIPNVVVSGPTTLPDVTLPAGDADNNNIVDIGDFGLLVNAYLGTFSDPTSGYDPRADFDFNGVNDIGDFGLLVNEFLTAGAP